MRHALPVIVLAVSVAIAPPIAAAQKATPAETLFREGRRLMNAGRTAEACDKFAESQRLEAAVGTLLNLEACHEALGALATAWGFFQQAADLAARSGDSERAEKIRRRAAALEPKIAKLRIRVRAPAPRGVRVSRAGVDVTGQLGTAVFVDPGVYTIEAVADGHRAWAQGVRVEPGAAIDVEVPALEPVVVAPPPAPKTAPEAPASVERRVPAEPPPEEDPGQGRRRVGITILVTGGAVTAAGLYFGWRAREKNEAYQKECPGGACTDETSPGFDLHHEVTRNANLSNAFLIVGLVASAGGVVLWRTAPGESGAHARLIVTGRGVAVAGGF